MTCVCRTFSHGLAPFSTSSRIKITIYYINYCSIVTELHYLYQIYLVFNLSFWRHLQYFKNTVSQMYNFNKFNDNCRDICYCCFGETESVFVYELSFLRSPYLCSWGTTAGLVVECTSLILTTSSSRAHFDPSYSSAWRHRRDRQPTTRPSLQKGSKQKIVLFIFVLEVCISLINPYCFWWENEHKFDFSGDALL